MEEKTCSRCNRLKDVNMFNGFKQCNTCRENRKASHHRNYDKNKDRINGKEERGKGTTKHLLPKL